MYLVPGDRAIERAAQDLSDTATGFFRLRKLLAPLTGFDLVVIDTPPAMGFAISSALLAADRAVLPTLTGQTNVTWAAPRSRPSYRVLCGRANCMTVAPWRR